MTFSRSIPYMDFKHFNIRTLALICLIALLSANAQAQTTPAKTRAAESRLIIEQLVKQASLQKNASRAIEYAERAVVLADSLGLFELKADALRQSGIAWKLSGDQLKSATRLMEAIELFSDLRLDDQLYMAKIDLGETYRATRTYLMSVENLNEALAYFTKQANSAMLAQIYNHLAATYYEMLFTHPDYMQIDEKGLEGHAVFIENLAAFPEIKSYYDKILVYLDTSNHIANTLNINSLIISNMNIQASLYNAAHDPLRALALYDEIIETIHKTGVTELLALVYINKARILGSYRMSKAEEAIAIALEALEMAKMQEINIYVFMAYEVLHDNYYAIGDYKNAYSSMIATRDLLERFNHEKLEILTQTQSLEHQIKAREFELQGRSNQIRLMVASIVIIVLIFLIFLFILTGKNRQQRSLLAQLNHKNQIITVQNEQLSLANSEKDKLFSIIAHDLKGPFQSILGFSEMLKDDDESLDKEDRKKLAGLLCNSAGRTMQLLDDLLHWARLQQDRIAFLPEDIPVGQLLNFISELMHDTAKMKNISIVSQLPEDLSLKADKEMLKTILRNLVSNAVKFSYPGSEIVISAKASNGNVEISVCDNGTGIPKKKTENLFTIGNEYIMPGTANEKGTGLGLVLCREFVEKHGGQIWVNSEEGRGSTFSFTIPSE